MARLHNSRVRVRQGELHELATGHGIGGPIYPPNFPASSEEIFNLKSKSVLGPIVSRG